MRTPQIYILHSEKADKYYIGSTDNLKRRIDEHQRGNTPSTTSGRPWTVVFVQQTNTLQEARRLEHKLKKWKNRTLIERIIKDQILRVG